MTPPRPIKWIIAGIIASIAAVALVLAAIAYGMVRPTADVKSPSADASPQRVVATYLQAMQVRDRDTMRDILLDDEQLPSRLDIITGDNLEIADVTVGEHQEWDAVEGSKAEGWQQAVVVPVDFRVTQSDGSFVEGEESQWSYLLVRDGEAEPWQIADEGKA